MKVLHCYFQYNGYKTNNFRKSSWWGSDLFTFDLFWFELNGETHYQKKGLQVSFEKFQMP